MPPGVERLPLMLCTTILDSYMRGICAGSSRIDGDGNGDGDGGWRGVVVDFR